jgi:GNAT superfamily N-acetyltransferase
MGTGIRLESVDYLDDLQAADLVYLVEEYAKDPSGHGMELSEQVKSTLPAELANVPGAFSFIAYCNDKPVGFINCFMGFSTLNAKPLVNVHDLSVKKEFRRYEISHHLLGAAEEVARSRHCCKITFEAQNIDKFGVQPYEQCGFAESKFACKDGVAQFWEKDL